MGIMSMIISAQIPQIPSVVLECRQTSSKHLKSLLRNKDTIAPAMKEQIGSTAFADSFFHTAERMANSCLHCGKSPSMNQKLSRCSKCQEAVYFSKECQRKDWPRHKSTCFEKGLEYPSFGDQDKSAKDYYF
jgi:hypothetical protein